MAKTAYGRLFKSTPHPESANASASASAEINKGGPAAVAAPASDEASGERPQGNGTSHEQDLAVKDEHRTERLHFVFAPDIGALINPRLEDLVEGTDKHAIHTGAVSVTPIRAAFMEARAPAGIPADGVKWRL